MPTTVPDLIHSNTAIAKKISNKPNATQTANLTYLCAIVDNAKAILATGGWYNPTLTSGFRTDALAVAVGGHAGDEHTLGLAFDLDCHLGDALPHLVAARWLFNRRHELGGCAHQIIAEPGHVHVGMYPKGKTGPTELRMKDGAHYPLQGIG